jgi:hypothetical protein
VIRVGDILGCGGTKVNVLPNKVRVNRERTFFIGHYIRPESRVVTLRHHKMRRGF